MCIVHDILQTIFDKYEFNLISSDSHFDKPLPVDQLVLMARFVVGQMTIRILIITQTKYS